MAKTVTILGSTGSIGESSLRVIESLNGEFRIYGLACRSNMKLLSSQIEKFSPRVVAVESKDPRVSALCDDLKKRYPGVEFLKGEEGVIELASREVDVLISAIVGGAGLRPTIAAIQGAGRIALANKETLVMAGDVFMRMMAESGRELIPVDSEHSAIFSLLRNLSPAETERVILTASGGGLRDIPVEKLSTVTPEMALAHPTWDMGSKITIDSATLMNKGLEVIEAHHLFNVDYDSIGVVIHPESIIHSMVETVDGAVYAHMGVPDMAFPIINALTYPRRVKNPFGRLRLEEVGSLNFFSYDRKRYPGLELCFQAGKIGGTMPAVLNAANEVAVETFLQKRIQFIDIVRVVEKTMEKHRVVKNPDLETIIETDILSRETSKRIIEGDL